MINIRKNDTVFILDGRDKGKTGSVIEVLPKKNQIKVSGIAIVIKHAKARKQGQPSEIIKKEDYINISKVMPVCTSCKKPARVSFTISENNKTRTCVRCKENF